MNDALVKPALSGPRTILPSAITLAVIGACFSIAPHFFHNRSLLFTMMTFVVLAQGLNLLYGFTGYLPFGYVGFFGAGAYAMSLLVLHTHLPALLCVVLGGVAAALIALILGPLLRLSGAYFSITSLAASQILYGLKIDQVYDPNASYFAMLVILLIATGLAAHFRFSRFGLSLRATNQDATSASMAGINVVRGRLIVWLVSAGVAGLAGAAYAWNLSVFYPDAVFSLQISVFAIVFALFGGIGTVIGPVVGAVVLDALYNGVGISAPQYFEFIYGVLIVLLVLFLPNGVMSLLTRRGVRVI
jgi:branched-chain amino acid transport system permease protein